MHSPEQMWQAFSGEKLSSIVLLIIPYLFLQKFDVSNSRLSDTPRCTRQAKRVFSVKTFHVNYADYQVPLPIQPIRSGYPAFSEIKRTVTENP